MCSRHRCGEESASMNRTEFFGVTLTVISHSAYCCANLGRTERSRACALVIMCLTDTATCPESRTNKAASKGDLGLPRTFYGPALLLEAVLTFSGRRLPWAGSLVVHSFGVDHGRPAHEANEPQHYSVLIECREKTKQARNLNPLQGQMSKIASAPHG